MQTRRDFVLRSAALAGAAAMPGQAFAQLGDYPSREIHTICSFPVATGADIFVRMYARKLQDLAKRTVIVENKPGAFGNIATEAVIKSKPDGYTVYIAPGSSVLAAAPSMFTRLPFDPINDLEHITTLIKLPFILVVAADSPYKTVADLVADLKKRGDKGSYGSSANTGIVASELFKANFGLETVEVKYKDSSMLLSEIIGGSILFGHIDYAGASGQISAGKIRALATTAKERFKSLPDIPSAADAGISNSNLIAWFSVHMPKGTPAPITAQMEKWFNQIAVDPEVQTFMAKLGADPFPGTSQSLKELLASDTKAWAEYTRLAKIERL